MLKPCLKKAALFFMLAFLLQINWSLAKAYCSHESGSAAQHVGHHQHQPHMNEEAQHSKSASVHLDCFSCVSAFNLMLPMEPTTIPSTSVKHDDYFPLIKIPSPYLALPERPQW